MSDETTEEVVPTATEEVTPTEETTEEVAAPAEEVAPEHAA